MKKLIIGVICMALVIPYSLAVESSDSRETIPHGLAGSTANDSCNDSQKSYIKIVDGNPTLFVGEKPLDILGLRTTSNPYKSDEAYQSVIEYIDKAANYGYSYVAVMLCWYRMDTTKHETFPEPEDVGKLMDWKKLDEIFNYARSKNVYIVPLFLAQCTTPVVV